MTPTAPLKETLLKLCRREDLTRDEARAAFAHLMSGQATDAQIGGLLVGLAAKGTTVEELTGAAEVMRQKALPIPCPPAASSPTSDLRPLTSAPTQHSALSTQSSVILDTCGTGGDSKHTFNISTTAALIVAAAGVRVVKHGNRSATSKSGSADVLEHLGLHLDLTPEQLGRCLAQTNICFAFARYHHPAMKFVGSARSSLGIPTVFNLLGPLTNPGRAKHQLLGVFAPELTDRLASVLRNLGSDRAWVVHAEDGLDELSTLCPTRISELKNNHIHTWTLDPTTLGLQYARLSDLQVHSVQEAAQSLTDVLTGQKSPKRDIALLNAAAALVIADAAPDLPTALKQAAQAVDSGAAQHTLDTLITCARR